MGKFLLEADFNILDFLFDIVKFNKGKGETIAFIDSITPSPSF